jgi:hypothetical protein
VFSVTEAWSIREWEELQLDDARIHGETRKAVRRLLDAWLADTGPHKVDAKLAFETFERLARGEALVKKDEPGAVWQAARTGQIHTRDRVRVKLDGYADQVGMMHNGRQGVVIAVRYGDVVVRYDDGRQPPFDGVHHPYNKLEKRIG